MAFDNETRGKLQKFVTDIRALLTEDFIRQLQQTYGMDPASGEVAPLDSLKHLDDERLETAQILRDVMDHYLASEAKNEKQTRISVLERIAREQAFTILNRLAALRMMEARGIVLESIGQGTHSQAFQLYQRVANGSLGDTGETYRQFLHSLFDLFAADLPTLFDRYGPQSRLFPREATLTKALGLINGSEIEPLWAEDETIGWIYQYFNSKDERKAMRDASQAPRNSRELAVRNQFFTPRYVVEFLVDNTLGRLWFNWTGGQTDLRDRCQYLLVKPDEQPEAADRLRDPRTIKLLDPACGSMHFGLYAFDLFMEIYREAWTWEQTHGPGCLDSETGGIADLKPLSQTYADQDAFMHDVPRLIIEHNIYGVDIDPRAAQIASLALWLRAQRAWHEAGVKAKDRPQVGRGNVVAAVAPPAEVDLRKRFMEELDPLDAELFEKTLFLLKSLPELGVLLQVEKELPALVQEVFGEHGDLFRQEDMAQWQKAEMRLREALTAFSRAAQATYQGRLFAEDALECLRVLDLTNEVFDAVVMNPPFGASPGITKSYLKKAYGSNSVELYCAFAVRSFELTRTNGLIGCISSSSFILYSDFSSYREILLDEKRLESLVDLGDSVLDGAYVSTASYVLRNAPPTKSIAFYDLRVEKDKGEALKNLVTPQEGEGPRLLPPERFKSLAGTPLCHWVSDSLFDLAKNAPSLNTVLEDAGLGAAPQADFFNLWWEVPSEKIGIDKKWVRISNGGSFSPFYRADYLVVDWEDDGKRAIADLNNRYPYLNGNVGLRIQRTNLFGNPGITYGKRTDRFNAQILPRGNIFTFEGIGVFPIHPEENYLLGLLCYLNSRFAAYYLNLSSGLHKNDVYLRRLPFPFSKSEILQLSDRGEKLVSLVSKALFVEETNPLFSGSFLATSGSKSILDMAINFKKTDRINEVEYFKISYEIDVEISRVCELDLELEKEISKDQGFNIYAGEVHSIEGQSPERERPGFSRSGFEKSTDLFRFCIKNGVDATQAMNILNNGNYIEDDTVTWFANSFLSYLLGSSFGRWDIRFATGQKTEPQLNSPTDTVGPSSPGMLQVSRGETGQIGATLDRYPIKICEGGILVDDPNHPKDIERHLQSSLEVVWKGKAEQIESEICEILSVSSVRNYFSRPNGFFKDHLERYSRSRRKAPIYWPLSTSSGSYTLWIYYPSLTSQTLYTAVNDFIEGPNGKLQQVENDLVALRNKGSARSAVDEKNFEKLQAFETELIELRETILEIAPSYRPNHDDGVQISAAPLWRLFRHKPWQKILKATWDKLENGDYDWAHLAMAYWPNRVREKCKTDKSLAIAHDLEGLYEEPEVAPGAKRGRKKAGAAT
tara:strand:- start:4709 stop:8755 length:4047 start_codon:yes stop_codon:yes gene_type:complete